MNVSSIMTSAVITVAPEVSLEALISLLVDENISGVPVVDAEGVTIGMVSKSDLLSEASDLADLSARTPERRTVADVMTSAPVSVPLSASIQEASALMVSHHVHRLTVVDAQARLVGIVTTFDITRWVAAGGSSTKPR